MRRRYYNILPAPLSLFHSPLSPLPSPFSPLPAPFSILKGHIYEYQPTHRLQALWSDLNGDGREELVWLSDAEWLVVWTGWQDENGTWRATGIAAGDDLALEGSAPPDEIQRGGIVVHYYGAERILRWDSELQMIHVPPDERPDGWPVVGGTRGSQGTKL